MTENNLKLVHIEGYSIITAPTLESGKARVICLVSDRIDQKNLRLIKIQESIDVIALDLGGCRIVGLYKGFKLTSNDTIMSYFEKYMKVLQI